MNYTIDTINLSEYPEVVKVWEASVRVTHPFVTEADIELFRPLILNEYLKMVDLFCIRNSSHRIIGFLGVAGPRIEMLFVHPEAFGIGVGKALLMYAIEKKGTFQIEVNEDNPKAVGFYEHFGFKTVRRTEVDRMGKPYPILYMERKQ